jgi:SRSO17 transposase
MSLLDSPEALALLEEAIVPIEVVIGCQKDLVPFLKRFLPLFYRGEQRELATVVIAGKLSGLQRKTSEPIAIQAQRHRKPVQHFVGAGAWDDEAVMAEVRRHVDEELSDASGVLVVDGSAFPKKGAESCGVDRQWCGRLGKLENCQVGVFIGYAGRDGHAPLDRRLYLTEDWANDRQRREKCHVPVEVVFQEKWRIGLDLLERCRDVQHGWIAADDEFGRVTAFRQALRQRRERYVVDVPGNTLLRELHFIDGHKTRFERVDAWAARQPSSRWQKITIRPGEKGELVVRALTALVQTKDEDHRVGRPERALVMRPITTSGDASYALSNALSDVSLAELVRVKSERHRIEELFQEGKGEVGLAHYEVRSWVGWHHHMTLSMLALWFLSLERWRWGEKGTRPHRAPAPTDHDPAPPERPYSSLHYRSDKPNHASQRRSPHLSLAQKHRQVSAASSSGRRT